jgi:hypothetical protein
MCSMTSTLQQLKDSCKYVYYPRFLVLTVVSITNTSFWDETHGFEDKYDTEGSCCHHFHCSRLSKAGIK